jgi:prepilin-type N-terminal cleavage/methylation domain-containing protein/prepilin-type processing-associated H-X9-DG protein
MFAAEERSKRVMKSPKGFTLIELLVVIAIIALLMSILMPALNKVKEQAKKVKCQAQQRQYGLAINAWALDNDGAIPWYGAKFLNGPPYAEESSLWYNVIAQYMTGKNIRSSGTAASGEESKDSEKRAKSRQCPSGKRNTSATYATLNYWEGWIGVNYGAFDNTLAPFLYGGGGQPDPTPPCKIQSVKHPAKWLMLLDCQGWFIYTPVSQYWRFDTDMDDDGLKDTMAGTGAIYNGASPQLHTKGCNITLVDGHVEWIAFKEFWKLETNGAMYHPYWYNK